MLSNNAITSVVYATAFLGAALVVLMGAAVTVAGYALSK